MDFDTQQPSSSSPSSFSNAERIESRESSNELETSNQEPSSSLSLSTKQEEMDKIKDGQEEKKLKADPQFEFENQDEVEMKCFIDELPPEMLMKIFNCLNIKSLVNSRLVSRKWNGIAWKIIQSSDGVVTRFTCKETEDGNLTIEKAWQTDGEPKATLENFIECFEDSKESPLYTYFWFFYFDPSVFDHADWIKFISHFGQSVKSLRLWMKNDYDLVNLGVELKYLLLNQLPNLQEFGLHLPHQDLNTPGVHQEIPLFPTTTSTVKLSHLKVLYLDEFMFSNFTGIVTDLLVAAVNLQKIESCEIHGSFGSVEIFQLLQSLGKLDCLQNASINLDADFMSKIQGKTPMPFKLKKLNLCVSYIYNSEAVWVDASFFISNLFESCKDTLKYLRVTPIGFLPNLQFPKFSKLNRLCIREEEMEENNQIQVLPSGLNMSEIFPFLQNLGLEVSWTDFFPHDENPNVLRLPNVKTLLISSRGIPKEEDIARIPQVCPNLKELTIYYFQREDILENFSEVGTAIWTYLTKLESLDLQILLKSPADAFLALHSCFTGFSREYCSRLHNLFQGEELLKESGWSYQIDFSKTELEAERKNPSILDLKDLKNLTVFLLTSSESEKMLNVSKKCAFQLMENLTYKIN